MLQSFATQLRQKVSRKTVVQVLVTISGIQKYAARQGVRAVVVSLKDLAIGRDGAQARRPFFTKAQAVDIIAEAKEPYQTLFTLAWCTGLRAGELLALTVVDVNFTDLTITVNKSADDNNRSIGQTKTETSAALLPMPSVLVEVLGTYLDKAWRRNSRQLLFPNRRGTMPMLRDNVVKYGLKSLLKQLGIPTKFAGLHAFRARARDRVGGSFDSNSSLAKADASRRYSHDASRLCSRNPAKSARCDGSGFNWNMFHLRNKNMQQMVDNK